MSISLEESPRGWFSVSLRAFIWPFLAVILAAFVARASLVQAFSIPSGSMTPTLEPGDFVVVTPFRGPFYGNRPERGDVVVFHAPGDSSRYLIKRIVAVPGDIVELRSGDVWINGRRVSEPGIPGRGDRKDLSTRILPAGRYFVLGDHREASIDSRTWGFLDEARILGKARIIFWSSHSGANENGSPVEEVRWSRILRPVR